MLQEQVLEKLSQLRSHLCKLELCVTLVSDLIGELVRSREHVVDVEANGGSEHVAQQEQNSVPKSALACKNEEDDVEQEENNLDDRNPEVHLRESVKDRFEFEG